MNCPVRLRQGSSWDSKEKTAETGDKEVEFETNVDKYPQATAIILVDYYLGQH